MNLEAIDKALAATREGLEVAGFSLSLEQKNGRLGLRITAEPAACEDCLVPKSLFLRMVIDEMAASGITVNGVDIVYPADKAD